MICRTHCQSNLIVIDCTIIPLFNVESQIVITMATRASLGHISLTVHIFRIKRESCIQFCPDCWRTVMQPAVPERPPNDLGKLQDVMLYSRPAINSDEPITGTVPHTIRHKTSLRCYNKDTIEMLDVQPRLPTRTRPMKVTTPYSIKLGWVSE